MGLHVFSVVTAEVSNAQIIGHNNDDVWAAALRLHLVAKQ
jgi:hypothetical protein